MQIFLCPFEKREIYLHISEKNCTFATKFAKVMSKTLKDRLDYLIALVSEFAANVRKVRQPEPYKGKGIKYKDEHIRRKEGKKAA